MDSLSCFFFFLKDPEEEDVKPDLAMLQAEALLAPGVDKQAWKKQQRMIRNRESAALSRKRKRDRIESLEEQVCVSSFFFWSHLSGKKLTFVHIRHCPLVPRVFVGVFSEAECAHGRDASPCTHEASAGGRRLFSGMAPIHNQCDVVGWTILPCGIILH